jgi:hypothetical protein
MEELRPGLWTWTGDHPEWTSEVALPLELVLPTHGEVTDRAAFEASLG